MQVIVNFQKNLAKIVVFNRIFSGLVLFALLIYLIQLNFSGNFVSIVFLLFGLVILVFHVLLMEVIGQIIRKKTILTHDICDWLAKVITISTTVVVSACCIATANLFFASFFVLPIIIGNFLGNSKAERIGIFAVVFVLLIQHTGMYRSDLFVNNLVGYSPDSLIQAMTIICVLVLAGIIANTARQTHEKTNILQSMATTDTLTGLTNRRYFDRRLTEEISRCKRHKSTLSLALLDVDFFKRINDTYGHTVGDLILKELGEIVLRNTRDCDISARYGGEEFALILPETTQIEASELLERLRQLVESYTFCKDDMPVSVTVSVGIAQYDPELSPKEFINQTDAALYQAKRTGRNKVVYGTFTTPKLTLPKKI